MIAPSRRPPSPIVPLTSAQQALAAKHVDLARRIAAKLTRNLKFNGGHRS